MLRTLPDESVQMCVTSPPYWGLRNYGTPPEIWGGDPQCEHSFIAVPPRRKRPVDETGHRTDLRGSKQQTSKGTDYTDKDTNICSLCGAWKGELGLEPTPELYVEHLTMIFREVRRVLKNNGTLWLNLGDSYMGGSEWDPISARLKQDRFTHTKKAAGYKSKDLIGAPWLTAFSLRADGWYLRKDIIWHKPNPMPESVTDRCTSSHEYIFHFAKSKKYYYDAEAIYEKAVYGSDGRKERSADHNKRVPTDKVNGIRKSKKRGEYNGKTNALVGREAFKAFVEHRNKRDVWTVPTEPYSGAHFAVFPEGLITPCILAGSAVGDTVLDPFFVSGTTGVVSRSLGREFIGIEINEEYIKLAERRLSGVSEYLFK
jgi:DNA modification methylase